MDGCESSSVGSDTSAAPSSGLTNQLLCTAWSPLLAMDLSCVLFSPAASQHETYDRSKKTDSRGNKTPFNNQVETEDDSAYWLRYWILQHNFVFCGLDYVSSQLPNWFKGLILWNFWLTITWILLLHKFWVVRSFFDILEAELVGLGLWTGEKNIGIRCNDFCKLQEDSKEVNISETRIAKFAHFVLQQLPRAHSLVDDTISIDDDKEKEQRREASCDAYPDLTLASSSVVGVFCVMFTDPFVLTFALSFMQGP